MKSILLVVALVLVAGANRVLADATAPKDLGAFYQTHCAGCHGVDGTARDANGKSLRGQDFTDARWLKSAKDAAMVKAILGGLFFGWAMPAYRSQLTADEAQRMVTEVIRTAAKGKVIGPAPAAAGDKRP